MKVEALQVCALPNREKRRADIGISRDRQLVRTLKLHIYSY